MNPLKMLSRGGAVSEPSDPDFQNVTLLLHGDGTNGAQNNTFLDSSTNNFTITRNGNTTQGTFSPFSKVDGRWGNYFDGSGDYLSVAQNSAFNFGTGAFTVEGWFYFWGSFGSVYNGLVNLGNGAMGGGPYTGWGLITGGTGTDIRWYRWDGTTETQYIGNFSFQVGTWYHIAACRNSSSNLAIFVNGTRVVSTTSSISYNNINGEPLNIGYRNDGVSGVTYAKIYPSNIRVVAGSTVYDPTQSSITVPSSPFTAISGTSLLTCQSNRFKDNSSNNFTITRNGDVKVTPFSPFPTLTAYDAATNGGSGYFDGSGDYLSATSNAAFALPGAFTFECWFYPRSFDQTSFWGDTIFSTIASNSIAIARPITSVGNSWGVVNAGVAWIILSTTLPTNNAWNHIVVVRDSNNNISLFLNGTRLGTTTSTVSFAQSGITIGSDNNASDSFLDGYLSNLRLVKGTAVYDPTQTTLTVPTAPVTAISGTSLLTNFTNAGILDNSMSNNLETVGNAQIDTTTKKYGTGAMEFDGTGDSLKLSSNLDFIFGTGDFTIECWLYLNSVSPTYQGIFDGRPSNGAYPTLIMSGAAICWYTNSNFQITGSNLSTATWYHIAVARSGTSTRLFVNGTQSGSTYSDSTNYLSTANPLIGALVDGFSLNGYIDDLRITKGKARYTSNFTPPTAALPDIGE